MPSEPLAPPTERPPAPGFQQIGVVFPKEDVKALKRVAVDQGTTMRALLAEAMAIVLERYGLPVSAELLKPKKLGRPPKRVS